MPITLPQKKYSHLRGEQLSEFQLLRGRQADTQEDGLQYELKQCNLLFEINTNYTCLFMASGNFLNHITKKIFISLVPLELKYSGEDLTLSEGELNFQQEELTFWSSGGNKQNTYPPPQGLRKQKISNSKFSLNNVTRNSYVSVVLNSSNFAHPLAPLGNPPYSL